MEFNKRLLLEIGMELQLMNCRYDRCLLEQAFELYLGVVGDADGPGFARLEGFFHGFISLWSQSTSICNFDNSQCLNSHPRSLNPP